LRNEVPKPLLFVNVFAPAKRLVKTPAGAFKVKFKNSEKLNTRLSSSIRCEEEIETKLKTMEEKRPDALEMAA